MFISNGQFAQVVVTSVINIEINISFYARQPSGVSMLPKFPFARIFNFVDIIMRNPVRVVVEYWFIEICRLKFIICVNNRLDMVFVFNNVKPCKYIALKILKAYILWLVLNV